MNENEIQQYVNMTIGGLIAIGLYLICFAIALKL